MDVETLCRASAAGLVGIAAGLVVLWLWPQPMVPKVTQTATRSLTVVWINDTGRDVTIETAMGLGFVLKSGDRVVVYSSEPGGGGSDGR